MQDLFHGSAPDQEFADPNEFRNVAHFLVPGFTPDEVDRLAVQSPELLRAARAVLAEMGDRIWVPFHLRLLAAVVETMPDTASMPSVPTAGRLLDLYWERCVVRRKDGEGAQSAKRLQAVVSVVRSMLRRKRLLLRDTEIATKWSSQIHILISDGVLVEGQAPGTRSVHFAHHALFDYIAARTSLAVDDPATLSRLAADPETALAFRPSLSLSFQRLWDVDASRRLFWDAALSWRANLASASLWLVPAVVAARSFQDPVDLEPLRRFVRASPVRASRSLAEEMLGLVIAVGVNGNCAALVGRNQASWCELARVLAAEAMPRIAWSLRFLLFNLVAQLREMTAPEVASTGAASRSLLQYATIHDERLIESALKCVALTSGSNAAETSVAIDPLLSRKQIESRGYRTLHTLSFHISPVIQASPELAGRIYEAAYTYEETSREPTAMGDSQIISMTSNRKQDFDGARYQLAEKFHELAAIDLALASRVVRRAFGVVRG
jgi:hypothetical protein